MSTSQWVEKIAVREAGEERCYFAAKIYPFMLVAASRFTCLQIVCALCFRNIFASVCSTLS